MELRRNLFINAEIINYIQENSKQLADIMTVKESVMIFDFQYVKLFCCLFNHYNEHFLGIKVSRMIQNDIKINDETNDKILNIDTGEDTVLRKLRSAYTSRKSLHFVYTLSRDLKDINFMYYDVTQLIQRVINDTIEIILEIEYKDTSDKERISKLNTEINNMYFDNFHFNGNYSRQKIKTRELLLHYMYNRINYNSCNCSFESCVSCTLHDMNRVKLRSLL